MYGVILNKEVIQNSVHSIEKKPNNRCHARQCALAASSSPSLLPSRSTGFMAPKAFETGIYALETAFGISQPHPTGTVDHLQNTFTLPDSPASQRNLAQRIRKKALPWNQGCINPRKRKSGNHLELHVNTDFGLLKQDTGDRSEHGSC